MAFRVGPEMMIQWSVPVILQNYGLIPYYSASWFLVAKTFNKAITIPKRIKKFVITVIITSQCIKYLTDSHEQITIASRLLRNRPTYPSRSEEITNATLWFIWRNFAQRA